MSIESGIVLDWYTFALITSIFLILGYSFGKFSERNLWVDNASEEYSGHESRGQVFKVILHHEYWKLIHKNGE